MKTTAIGLAFALTAFAPLQAQAPAPTTKKSAPVKTAAAPKMTDPVKALQFPALRPVKIPEVTTFTLPNGMKVFLLENNELPLVSGTAMVRAGNLFDPKDKVGLAGMTGSVMRTGGTKSKTGDQLDEQLENIAASVETGIGETSGSASFSALKENTDEVLAIFKDLLINPEFRQDKIDLYKIQARGSLLRRNDNPGGIASREFTNIVYGRDNPYGWTMEYEHIDRIKREDLVEFHKRYFFPANMILSVQGDFKAPEMRAKLEKLFADWTAKQPPVPAFPQVTAKPSPGVYLAVKPDVNQTFFQLGHLGGVLRDKDYAALDVMADILGGGFSSRLFAKVRTELGYAYNVGANWGANYNHPGIFRVSGSTKSQSTTETIETINQEIERLRNGQVTDTELATAKGIVLNGFVFNFDHPAKTLQRMVTYEYHGYPRDFMNQYQSAIDAVTKADIQRVARQYLKPENFTVVAVGKPDDFGKPLTALDPNVKTIDLTIPMPGRETARSDAASLDKGKALLQRAQGAVGGADRLAGIKDLDHTAAVSVDTGQGNLQIEQRVRWVSPGSVRQEQQMPFGRMVVFADAKGGWMATPQGLQNLPPEALKQASGEMFRSLPHLLLSDRAADRTVNLVGDNEIEIADKSGNSARMTVDNQTGLPAKLKYQGMSQQGLVETEVTYLEWKEDAGIKMPQRLVVHQGGRKFAEVTIKEWKINSGIKAEDLAQKPQPQ